MEPTSLTPIITGFLSTAVTLVLGLILLVVRKGMAKNTKSQDAQTEAHKEQTEAFNTLVIESRIANVNYKNLSDNIAANTELTTNRLNSHAKDIKALSISEAKQDIRLKDHDKRFDKIESKIWNG